MVMNVCASWLRHLCAPQSLGAVFLPHFSEGRGVGGDLGVGGVRDYSEARLEPWAVGKHVYFMGRRGDRP